MEQGYEGDMPSMKAGTFLVFMGKKRGKHLLHMEKIGENIGKTLGTLGKL